VRIASLQATPLKRWVHLACKLVAIRTSAPFARFMQLPSPNHARPLPPRWHKKEGRDYALVSLAHMQQVVTHRTMKPSGLKHRRRCWNLKEPAPAAAPDRF